MNYPYGFAKKGSDAAFPKAEFDGRRARAQAALAEKGIDLLLLTGPENIFYLSGQQTPGFYTFQCFGLPQAGEPFLLLRGLEAANARANTYLDDMIPYGDDANATEALSDLLSKRGWAGKRVALDRKSYYLTVAQYEQLKEVCGAFLDGSNVVEPLRAVKSARELRCIEKAAAAVEAGMRAATRAVKAGRTENDVAAAMVAAEIAAGSEYFGMDPFVCTGPRSGLRHATWRRRKLRTGDAVTLENAGAYNRYHAALFRTACVGGRKAADKGMLAFRDAVVEGCAIGIEAVRPGNTCADVHNAVQRHIDRLGFTDYFRKRAGYSIGLAFGPDWGEGHILSLYHNQPAELKPGMVFHMPVTLSLRGKYTVGCSETIVVTAKGRRVLSRVPRAIF
jgi:Xaa-Pro dipeptidase